MAAYFELSCSAANKQHCEILFRINNTMAVLYFKSRVLKKIQQDQTQDILVVPDWKSQP